MDRNHLEERLTLAVQALASPPHEELAKLLALGVVRTYPAGSLFAHQGAESFKFCFVGSGLFRYVYKHPKGRDLTKAFMEEGAFVSCYSAMAQGKPCFFDIEALEDSDVLEFDYRDWQRLRSGHSTWTDFLLALLERGYMEKERRERELLLDDADTRYHRFCSERASLVRRVRQHMIASYLGIAPESLSRLRRSEATRSPG